MGATRPGRQLIAQSLDFNFKGTLKEINKVDDQEKRIASIFGTDEVPEVKDETLRDTLIDLHNYSTMAIILLDEKKMYDKDIVKENPD